VILCCRCHGLAVTALAATTLPALTAALLTALAPLLAGALLPTLLVTLLIILLITLLIALLTALLVPHVPPVTLLILLVSLVRHNTLLKILFDSVDEYSRQLGSNRVQEVLEQEICLMTKVIYPHLQGTSSKGKVPFTRGLP
jgi:hypothetical protein